MLTDEEVKTQLFQYSKLHSKKDEIVKSFNQDGFIGVSEVPDFLPSYKRFITEEQKFVALSDAERNRYKPKDFYINGWSYGVESFNGIIDTYKGSYYAKLPNDANNIWPNEAFEKSYLKVGQIIFNVGLEILQLLDLDMQELAVNNAICRMLYYNLPQETERNPNWCGEHKDHGLFTGLAPAVYFNNKLPIAEPHNAGLYVKNKKVTLPQDVILFQIGEVLQLISNGKFQATSHRVQKAPVGCERFAFAVFFVPKDDLVINSTVKEYDDRYQYGMSYLDWSNASLNKYNKIK